ncbi:MAG: hypothetical protein ACRC9L_07790 [Brevinema sp.]
MILYRLFRYFIVVFSLIFLILFFVRDVFSPFPDLNNIFNSIDSYYTSLGKKQPEDRNFEVFLNRLEDAGTRLLAPLQNSMDQFLSDPEFTIALELLKNGNFDDWEYLIRSRLIADKDFHDLTVTYENQMIYRYENAVINAPLTFTNTFDTMRGRFIVTFYYDTDPIMDVLSNILFPIAVKIRSDVFYSPSLNRVFPSFFAQVTETNLPELKGVAIENTTQTLYYYKLYQNLQTPILLFTLETIPTPPHSYAKLVFFIFIIIFICVIFVLDRIICHFFVVWKRKKVRNREFSQYRNAKTSSNDEPNFDWLDDLARSHKENHPDDKND